MQLSNKVPSEPGCDYTTMTRMQAITRVHVLWDYLIQNGLQCNNREERFEDRRDGSPFREGFLGDVFYEFHDWPLKREKETSRNQEEVE